ncbi:acyltransferase domain-containing protein [Paenibacillus hemerocallicola]|uniref:Malonyl CoA-acyl carrier protein transacylase n=1 Tax=Paenibacillus hemerocallicola TaxID=1172614 RepID=A0A5C4TAN5_9BACL|nr:acyltransferase domain-containing protein [Paenibacillus hemerocallicola]TNJ66118.1 acyltransferase domain-containing protein [Paenibacillus hemerocallicola]
MSVAFLFPGQGSQSPGMLSALPTHRVAQDVLAEASDVLQQDIHSLETAEALSSTIAVQLATFIAGVATATALEHDGMTPKLVAGHSVGAFAAAVVAKTLKFADALLLVKRRAEWMEQAFPHGYGMGVVVGLDEERLSAIVQKVHAVTRPVNIANKNASRQFTVAGHEAALEMVLDGARKAGASKAVRLPVRVPSHCALMAPIEAKLKEALERVAMSDATVLYAANVNARAIRAAASIRTDLHASLSRPVMWYEAMVMFYERGVRLFVEMSPGRVLTSIAEAAFPSARAVSVNVSGLEAVRSLYFHTN